MKVRRACPRCGLLVREDRLEKHFAQTHQQVQTVLLQNPKSEVRSRDVPKKKHLAKPVNDLSGSRPIEIQAEPHRKMTQHLPGGLSSRQTDSTRLEKIRSLKPTKVKQVVQAKPSMQKVRSTTKAKSAASEKCRFCGASVSKARMKGHIEECCPKLKEQYRPTIKSSLALGGRKAGGHVVQGGLPSLGRRR
jgi:phage FluMu protein Com